MTEEEAKAVTNQEVGNPGAATTAENNQSASNQEPTAGSKEYNFRRLEGEKKELERRLREQEQFNRDVLTAIKGQGQQAAPNQTEEESLPELSPDDIPEWKHIKKTYSALEKKAEKIAEEKVKQILAAQEKARLPELVKSRYSDFNEIVTAERVEQLEKEKPHLAKAFALLDDPFTAAYEYFKSINGKNKVDSTATEELEKIRENAKKPKSINAIGAQGALKNANTFASKPKEQLYKEMMKYSNGV